MAQTKAQLVVGLNVNASAPASALQIDASGNVNLDSNTLYVDATNNRVGIGTSTVGSSGNANITIAGANNSGIQFSRTNATAGGGLITSASGPGISFFHYSGAVGSETYTEGMRLTSTGLGIGTTSPSSTLHVAGPVTINNADATNELTFSGTEFTNILSATTSGFQLGTTGAGYLAWLTNNSERARIDSSGRLLVGTSSSVTTSSTFTPGIQNAASGLNAAYSCGRYTADSFGPAFIFQKSRNTSIGSQTIIQSGDQVGRIEFEASDGTAFKACAYIYGEIDGTPGSNDMPGRLVFSTTADGASSPTERMRIGQNGYLKVSNDGSYLSTTAARHDIESNGDDAVLYVYADNVNYGSAVIVPNCTRSASSAYHLLLTQSGNGADNEHSLRGDGNGYCDGSWNGGGADYAEYFEWSDANQSEEDRRGISVVLDGDKIREAINGEDPIGVISGNPSVVGDAAWNKWIGKYLRDEFGSYLLDENGDRQLNPAYDPDVEYISREQRPEWDCVGLMGKLRIRKGQVTGSRWIKMRDISDTIEEWLVR